MTFAHRRQLALERARNRIDSGEDAPPPRVTPDWVETGVCVQCGRSHDAQHRRRLLRPMAHLPVAELREAWPCFYPSTDAGDRMLFRDLAAVRRLDGRAAP